MHGSNTWHPEQQAHVLFPFHFVRLHRDGIIPGLAEYYPGGQVFNTTGRSTTAGNTTTTSTITAAPVRNTTSNRAANQPGSRGSGPVSLEPGSKDAKNAAKLEKVLQPPSLSTAVQKYVQNAPPAVQVFAATPIGKDLIGRIPDSQLSKLTSRATAFIQNVTDTAVQNWQGPMDDLSAAANNITSTPASVACLLATCYLGCSRFAAGLLHQICYSPSNRLAACG